jgi:hypothetical protein
VLDRSPLIATHRAGARVGQEVDHDHTGRQLEEVVVCCTDGLAALGWRGHRYRFNGVNPERFDDRLVSHDGNSRSAVAIAQAKHVENPEHSASQ